MTYAEHKEWVKTLTDDQLVHCLYEMRDRGWAIAAYTASDMAELFDIPANRLEEAEATFDRDSVEEAMCEKAREVIRSAIDGVVDIDDDEEA